MDTSFSSAAYWQERYRSGGTSGVGSYGKLAEFKASVLNRVFIDNEAKSVIDYGVGDGNQAKMLNLAGVEYTGLDISDTVIQKCRSLFSSQENMSFSTVQSDSELPYRADVTVSCDILYHLIEEGVYLSYMDNLFTMASKVVVIYACNENRCVCRHVKYRNFLDMVRMRFPGWELASHIINPLKGDDTSQSDFYIFSYQPSRINVIMCTWKRLHNLKATIEDMDNQDVEGHVHLHIVNNNTGEKGTVDSIVKDTPTSRAKVSVAHRDNSYAGFERFNYARDNTTSQYVIMVDDDQHFPKEYIRKLYEQRSPKTYTSWWSRKWKKNQTYWGSSSPSSGGEMRGMHYCGTGGSVIDASIFNSDSPLFNIPDVQGVNVRKIEDLWLSCVAKSILKWTLVRTAVKPTEPRTSTQDTSVALWKSLKKEKEMLFSFLKKTYPGWLQ